MKSLRRTIAWISMVAFVLGYLIQPVSIYADAVVNDTVSSDVDIQDGAAAAQPMDGAASTDGGVDGVKDEDMDSDKVADDSGAFEPTDSESTLVEGSSTSGGAGRFLSNLMFKMKTSALWTQARMHRAKGFSSRRMCPTWDGSIR